MASNSAHDVVEVWGSGLTKAQAEALLDWLEVHGIKPGPVSCGLGDSFTVFKCACQAEPAPNPVPAPSTPTQRLWGAVRNLLQPAR